MSVLVATPCYGGMMTTGYQASMSRAAEACDVDFLMTNGEASINRARNNMAATFLRHPEYDVLAFIDADIEIEPDDFKRLAALDKPVRGAAVAMKGKSDPPPLSCWVKDRQMRREDMPDEPFRVDYLGAAVLFIRRDVVQTLSEEWDRLLGYDDPIVGPGVALFECTVINRAYLTEDYGFCEMARRAGFDIWCDPSVVVNHYGQGVWRG